MTKRFLVNLIHCLISRLFILLSHSSFEAAICYLSWKQFFPGQRKWYEAAFSFSQACSQDNWVQKLATECRGQSPNRDRCCSSLRPGSELGRWWCLSLVANVLLLKKKAGLPFYCQNRREIWLLFSVKFVLLLTLLAGWQFLWSSQLLFFSVAFWGDGTPFSW